MSSNYEFNPSQKDKLLAMENIVNGGKNLIVVINNNIYEECYLEKGMRAHLINMHVEETDTVNGETDIIYQFNLDFTAFEAYNTKLESPDWRNNSKGEFNLTATQAGMKPKDCKESVLHSITHGDIFFEVLEDEKVSLVKEYIEAKTDMNYTEWLENKILSK